MILAAILSILGSTGQTQPPVAWVKLQSGNQGLWSAKAVYPKLPESDLNRAFNRDMKWATESLYREFVEAQNPQSKATFVAQGILSVADGKLASGLVSVQKSREPKELFPVTCWLDGKQAVRATWGTLVASGTQANEFADTLLLPALNKLRKEHSLDAVKEFPSGLLDSFVVTKSNVCWIVPPGVAGKDAEQVKISHKDLKPWARTPSPVSYLWTNVAGVPPLAFTLLVKWPYREDVPKGGDLQVSLFRNRIDIVPLAMQSFPLKDPPMEVRCEYSGLEIDPEERLYVDVRIVLKGQTLYRNRELARMPALGWQTIREMRLDRER